jgi:hypothetical protein
MRTHVLFTLILASAFGATHAANDDLRSGDVCSGQWRGYIDASVTEFALTVSLRRSETNQCTGTINIPERDILDVPLRDLKIEDGVVSFSTLARGAVLVFRGRFLEGEQRPTPLRVQGSKTKQRHLQS